MKSKKIAIVLIMLIISICHIVNPVNAANNSFTFTANPTQATAKLGDTITVNLGIADIDQDSDGINAIQGDMSYDKELFESVEIVAAGNSWNLSFNNEENNPLKGRFVLTNMNGVKEAGTVAILKAKIKSNATVTSGVINLKDVFSSYGTTETVKSNKTITINIEAQEQEKPTEPEKPAEPQEPEKPTPPANNNNSGTEQKPNTNDKNTSTQTTNKNTSKAPSLPKAGASSWMVIGVVVTTIGAVIAYIRYKKVY